MAIQANQALIQGAYKKAEAKAALDTAKMQTEIWQESSKGIDKIFTDTMADVMGGIKLKKDQEKVAFEKGLEPFKAIANQAYEKLYSQGEPLPQKFIDAVTREVESLQEEFEAVNTEFKNDTRANERKRMEIQGRLKRITNEAINARASFMKIGQSAGNWNETFIDPNNIGPMQSILDLENADKNDDYNVDFIDGKLTVTIDNVERTGIRSSVGFIEDTEKEEFNEYGDPIGMPEIDYDSEEEEEYKYTESVSFNLGDMEKALPTKNKATDAKLVKDLADNEEAGLADAKAGRKNKWTELKIEREEHAYATSIKTPAQFQDHIREIDGIGNGGFVEALWGNIDIPVAVISTMFVDDEGNPTELGKAFNQLNVDDSDNVINEKDYEILRKNKNWGIFEKNIEALHDALTNVRNPAFHLKTSVDLLAKYKVALDRQAYDISYKDEMGEITVIEGEDINEIGEN
tara:strand:- start:3998 stop:5380 length:1383 start_codon:yes stop_codon:yes gene_type:complete